MLPLHFWARVQGRYIRSAARLFFKRPLAIKRQVPLISFTFDDFPRSAWHTGGAILQRHGLQGTYYASFGLMGKQAPTGTMFLPEDMKGLLEQGHELGCHTFNHCHSWETRPDLFEESIIKNQRALQELVPQASFQTFAYPISVPRLAVKKVAGRHFLCCRGGGLKEERYLHRHAAGGQTFNWGVTDLNYLCAFSWKRAGTILRR